MILRSAGVPEKDAASPEDVNGLEVGDDTQVTCAVLGESDDCVFCAACGEFIRHGIMYPGEDVGCLHDLDEDALEAREGPHPDLKDAPAMRAFWS